MKQRSDLPSWVRLAVVTVMMLSVLGCVPQGEKTEFEVSAMGPGILASEEVTADMQDPLAKSVVKLMVLVPPKKRLVGGYRDDSYICSGILVAPQIVLTAAHCIKTLHHVGLAPSDAVLDDGEAPEEEDLLWAELQVVSHDGSIVRKAVDLKPHPNYQNEYSGRRNDLGFVVLDKPFYDDPKDFRKISFARDRGISEVGGLVMSYGYGVSSFSGGFLGIGQTPHYTGLRRKALRIIDADDRSILISSYDDSIFLRNISGQEVGGLCYGDSGGATFIKVNGEDVLLGVNSYKAVFSSCSTDSALMSVADHYEWITDTIRSLEGGSRP